MAAAASRLGRDNDLALSPTASIPSGRLLASNHAALLFFPVCFVLRFLIWVWALDSTALLRSVPHIGDADEVEHHVNELLGLS